MTEDTEHRALFASSRDALVFALNFEDSTIPSPVMNREMAMGVLDRAKSEAAARSYAGTPSSPRAVATKRSVLLGGSQDRTVYAGWILQRFQHLDVMHRLILTLTVMRPRTICSCGAPCCRGWTVKIKWVEAVRLLCEHLHYQAVLPGAPDKKGLSTDPRLRQMLVEEFAKPVERRSSLTDMARDLGMTSVTVAKHRSLIYDYLAALAGAAWLDLDAVFDAHGITGNIS